MQFLLLVYLNENAWRELPEPDKGKMLDDCQAYGREITASQHLLAGAPLVHSSNAVTIRTSNGQAVYTDGPFAETKEVLGGYHLVECRDREEAVRLGERFPGLGVGMTIEVREVVSGDTHCHGIWGTARR
jgi:hypothetical protein